MRDKVSESKVAAKSRRSAWLDSARALNPQTLAEVLLVVLRAALHVTETRILAELLRCAPRALATRRGRGPET